MNLRLIFSHYYWDVTPQSLWSRTATHDFHQPKLNCWGFWVSDCQSEDLSVLKSRTARCPSDKIWFNYLKVLQRNKRCYSVKVEDWIDINTNSEYDTCELRNHLFYQKKNEYEHSSLLTRTNALLTWNVGSDTLTLDTWLVWMWLQESPGPWGRRQQVSTGRPSASKSSWRETLLLN